MKLQAASPVLASKISRLNQTNRASAVVGIAMLVLVVCIAVWSLQQAASTEYWVTHTYQVISASYQLLYDIKDAQASVRAYLLQPTPQYRNEFETSATQMGGSLTLLQSLTADNPAQQARLNLLAPLLIRRTGRLRNLMSVRDSQGAEAAERLREERLGKQDADQVQSLCNQIQSEEYKLGAEREHLRHIRQIQGMSGTIGSAFLAFLALFISSTQVRRAIRDLVATDQQRHQSESMVASLFEAAPEAILVVDSAAAVRRTNPEAEQLFGYVREELINQPAGILVPDSLRDDFDRLSREFFNSSGTQFTNRRAETTLVRKGGSEFFAAVSLGRIDAATGTFAVLFVSDISQRRADEALLRANADELRSLTGKLLTAQEDERRRIARNLHDDLNQSLACLAMDLGSLASKRPLEDIPRELSVLRERTRQSANLVRSISHQLHPSILEDLGLKPALIEYCEEFQQRAGILINFECSDNLDGLAPAVASCIYYVAGECLRNVANHAHATSATVILNQRENCINLSVIDDGVGFTPQPGRTGIGITAMRERLHLLNGNLAIGPAKGRGTEITATLPLS